MKKLLSVFILLLCLALTSCGSSADKKVVNVYNWGEYISDGSEGTLDTNAAFEEYYFETYGEEIEVVYTTYASNEDMYAKLKSGAAGYDVVIPSDYMIARLVSEGMLEKIDFSNIPNYSGIGDSFKGLYYDPTNEYSIPYTYGMVGVIYNTTVVDEEDTGKWDLLWNPKYAGRILQMNNSRDAFGTAMYKLGIDVNTTDESKWRESLEELKLQQPHVQGYVMDEIFNKMESGEASVSAYYAGDYLSMADNNEDLAFYYPVNDSGEIVTNLFVDAYCIPKGAANKELAEIYINFMLSEEPAVANAEYICYASPNSAVYESEVYIEDMGEDAIAVLYPGNFDFSARYNELSYHNLDAETLALVNNLWEELKISSATGEGVYILASLIVISLAAYWIYHTIVRRKRAKYY
ncbi:MAG: spermidine/putrescine ABC transporter substrate-binding protein [Clostridia bacterium]|nr:spermidine/putrescine ABC transporter substrate-binding protein [Clostridia bacterium]MBQ6614420.1 spermidine/putrescine ABC transporter substrate-binding protein [Clostridia bacterium]